MGFQNTSFEASILFRRWKFPKVPAHSEIELSSYVQDTEVIKRYAGVSYTWETALSNGENLFLNERQLPDRRGSTYHKKIEEAPKLERGDCHPSAKGASNAAHLSGNRRSDVWNCNRNWFTAARMGIRFAPSRLAGIGCSRATILLVSGGLSSFNNLRADRSVILL